MWLNPEFFIYDMIYLQVTAGFSGSLKNCTNVIDF